MRVAVVGLGAIGAKVAQALDQGIPGLTLAAVAGRDRARVVVQAAALSAKVQRLAESDMPGDADLVVDCAPSATLAALGRRVLGAGRMLMTVNAGALLSSFDLVDLARAHGGRIIVPTGALLGLDAVRAAAKSGITAARMITRKPPAGLEGAPYLVEKNLTLAGLKEPTQIFEGSAREGAKGFPANVNVAAALALAGIGPDRTRLEIWAEPGSTRNRHRIEIASAAANFSMEIEGVPSPENPRTGLLTPCSVIACLEGLTSPLKIGS